jgi:hypothetical protein
VVSQIILGHHHTYFGYLEVVNWKASKSLKLLHCGQQRVAILVSLKVPKMLRMDRPPWRFYSNTIQGLDLAETTAS